LLTQFQLKFPLISCTVFELKDLLIKMKKSKFGSICHIFPTGPKGAVTPTPEHKSGP